MAYITAKCFEDFKKNQDQLIQVLNHSVTKLSYNVQWIKWLTCSQLVALVGTAIAIIISNL